MRGGVGQIDIGFVVVERRFNEGDGDVELVSLGSG